MIQRLLHFLQLLGIILETIFAEMSFLTVTKDTLNHSPKRLHSSGYVPNFTFPTIRFRDVPNLRPHPVPCLSLVATCPGRHFRLILYLFRSLGNIKIFQRRYEFIFYKSSFLVRTFVSSGYPVNLIWIYFPKLDYLISLSKTMPVVPSWCINQKKMFPGSVIVRAENQGSVERFWTGNNLSTVVYYFSLGHSFFQETVTMIR